MDKEHIFNSLLEEIRSLVQKENDARIIMTWICDTLVERIPYYDWVGFYLTDTENVRELVLGPYIGETTDHTRIGFGKGICGQAAENEETLVIPDVRKHDNYLSCSINVRSEIVVPMFKDGKLTGEIDIDSHSVDPFDLADRNFLEKLAELVGPTL